MGLLKSPEAKTKILIADFSRLTSLAYPIARLEHLRLTNDWMYWIFFYDDVLEISETAVAEQMKSNIFAIMDNKPWIRSNNDYLNSIYQAWEDINQCLIKELAEFEQTYQEIENEPAKKAYADGLRHWIIGHEEWGKRSFRYQGNKQKEVQENIESVEKIALIQLKN